jgi:hypothetical protein
MKSLRAIGHVEKELASNVSEAVFVSLNRTLCDINNYSISENNYFSVILETMTPKIPYKRTIRYISTRWRSWLKHYATSRKVARSSPDEVNFFILPNSSSITVALSSTQPLTEMSTRNLSAV